MKFDPYKTLGVARDASLAAIKKAYRGKAKQHHPDTSTGDAAKFHEAARAVAILLDAGKRKKFDETGEIDDTSAHNDPLGEPKTLIMHFFMSAVASPHDIFSVDLIEKARENFTSHIKTIEDTIRTERNKIARCVKLEKRLKHKDNNDFVRAACRSQVRELEEVIRKHEKQIEIRNQALTLLADYGFDYDKPVSYYTMTGSTASTTGSIW